MEKIKIGDILLMDGKAYVSMDMYKDLQHQLNIVQETAESFLQRLASIEVANENQRAMKIIKIKR